MKVYTDDMLIKNINVGDHLAHSKEMFDVLRIYNMKLNPNKCEFEVFSEKFLYFIVN